MGHLKAQPAPTQSRAQPERLESLPGPQASSPQVSSAEHVALSSAARCVGNLYPESVAPSSGGKRAGGDRKRKAEGAADGEPAAKQQDAEPELQFTKGCIVVLKNLADGEVRCLPPLPSAPLPSSLHLPLQGSLSSVSPPPAGAHGPLAARQVRG